jgi:hypothetical protein
VEVRLRRVLLDLWYTIVSAYREQGDELTYGLFLEALDIDEMDTFLLVGILTVTAQEMDFPPRKALAKRVCARLHLLDNDRAPALYKNLITPEELT